MVINTSYNNFMYKFNNKKKLIAIAVIISVIIFLVIAYYNYINTNEEEMVMHDETLTTNNINTEKVEKVEQKSTIVVHVAGAVVNPGVVELEEGSRISDAIEKAGGTTENADMLDVNLALLLEDGMKVYIPNHNENSLENTGSVGVAGTSGFSSNSTPATTSPTSRSSKVNINSASQTELETLPGIGASTASKIITYRKENGKFGSIEDIKKVKGIGTSKYEKIKEYICIK